MKGQPCEAGSEQLHVEEQLSVLNEPNLPNHLQVIADLGIEEVNNANMVDPDGYEDLGIKLCTTSLGFALA